MTPDVHITLPAPANGETVAAFSEWEQLIRQSWRDVLQPLETIYMWHTHIQLSRMTFVFTPKGTTTSHRNTNWFVIEPYEGAIVHYPTQLKSFQAVTPAAGIVDTYWNYQGRWRMMMSAPYNWQIRYDRKRGQYMNGGK